MKDIKPAILLFIVFTLICGGVYPALVTVIAQAVFPKQAMGSFITGKNGKEIGSVLNRSTLLGPKILLAPPLGHQQFQL